MIWFLCSASGGTGKTRLACALAEEAAGRRKTPLLVDAAGSMQACASHLRADRAILCLTDVLTGCALLREAVYPCAVAGVRLAITSFDGYPCVSEYGTLLRDLRSSFDPIIVDTGTGEEGPAEDLLEPNDRMLVLAGPEEVGLQKAAQRLFRLENDGARCDLLINFAPKDRRSQERLSSLAEEITGRRPLLFLPQEMRTDERAVAAVFKKAAEKLLDR